MVEPRSNTMKLGVHRDQLAPSLAAADAAWFLNAPSSAGICPRRSRRSATGCTFATRSKRW